MELFENILITIVVSLAAVYLTITFYSKWKSLTDPSSPPSCGDGCGSCGETSCNDKEFPSAGL